MLFCHHVAIAPNWAANDVTSVRWQRPCPGLTGFTFVYWGRNSTSIYVSGVKEETTFH